MSKDQYTLYFERISKRVDVKRIHTSKAKTLAFGTDASFYRLIPKMVIDSKSIEEASFLVSEAHKLGLPVTFRAAGTSLSGQAITDSILILTANHWKDHEIIDNGEKIKLQPGVIGARANTYLKPYQRKIGPDPASINSAMIGGIAANNASGMCCGTAQNSYNTVADMRIVFYDGTILDTSSTKSIEAFKKKHKDIYDRLSNLIKNTKNNKILSDRIREKFKMKNTTGYSLNALVDYEDPIDVIKHLMIGSEGTLGMIADITYHTVTDHPYKASSLMIFDDIKTACEAVILLKSAPVTAVELMDRASLKSVEDMEGVPDYLSTLSKGASAILVETRSSDKETLTANVDTIIDSVRELKAEIPITFTDDPDEYSKYWKIRKGLFPSVGAIRNLGTTVVIEDVTFPIHHLAEATLDLQELCKTFGYTNAVIFGHALEGNLHFVFTQSFDTDEAINRYKGFMEELAVLVVDKYDGALKAEHGTGRNMAPFVIKEWGETALQLMKDIKNIFDPLHILNPGVILNDDKEAHLKNLKPLPASDPIIDKCIECGFCESSCVSNHLTFSPRQRIVLHREIARLEKEGKKSEARALEKEIEYGFDQTCATDGLCALACPVKIDTGAYVKKLRTNKRQNDKPAQFVAEHMSTATSGSKIGLKLGHTTANLLGDQNMTSLVRTVTSITGSPILWSPQMPKASKFKKIQLKNDINTTLKVVYFSTCINRTFGADKNQKEDQTVYNKIHKLLDKANCDVIYPNQLEKLCCGMAYSSQGYQKAADIATLKLKESLMKASDNGKHPILCDMSPCLYTMKQNLEETGLKIYDITEFTIKYLKDRLTFKPVDKEVAIFSVCSLKKMGLEDSLVEIANLCSTKVYHPETNCCGFAGNKGFNTPELNAHGLRNLKDAIPETVKEGYATSRTCEVGLSMHSGIDFQSITNLIDEATESKSIIKSR
ncbi:FAD-binding and (Fe-S)-binding domain-containing protein [Aquimarina algicola]|uniref:FAD-binding and (Fe-S)-binding domain-containing protein n=1 Tax=Aquimarina algicola TaxID=2589995 RepID=UPI001CF3CB73|nr:FAD-binding and (Fe-S)-binding domain-containing protein [Aquimarina algicola]